ncbi:MAG TPA: site-2 protease family protein [Solirubrobacterales bacterium]|nr:site-2 protease family protein [Solirubrobacterales bacterium]
MFGLGGGSITLFHFRGIRVSVDWSWFIVLFLVILYMTNFFEGLLDEGGTTPFLFGVLSAIGFFGSILLHEFGHAVAARRNGIGITGIQLWIFGGMARMDREADTPGTELKVALAGPAVTFAIVVVLALVGTLGSGWTDFREAAIQETRAGVSPLMALIAWLVTINALVLVFNLLPAYPMDGGRVAKAIAWWRTGDRNKATRFAANLGRLFGYLFIGGGLVLLATGYFVSGIWLAFIGMIINGSARGAAMQTAISSRIGDVRVADVMDREPVAIPGDLSIEQALDEYFLRYRWPWFPVVDAGRRFLGLLMRDRADEVPEFERAGSHVSDLVDHDIGLFVRDDTPLDALLANQNLRRLGALMAVDAEGRLSGVVTIEQVGRALRDSTAGP